MTSLTNTGPADHMLSAQSFQALHASQRMPTTANGRDLATMRKTAREFEAVFISQMLQPMFENLSAEAPFGGGHGEDVWRSMQVQEYGKAISKAGGIGIADTILREMIKMQEAK
ncbi:MAG: rod-binding protein [Rhodospirillaceae bacterium]|jgi:flagellar protein FlgJ